MIIFQNLLKKIYHFGVNVTKRKLVQQHFVFQSLVEPNKTQRRQGLHIETPGYINGNGNTKTKPTIVWGGESCGVPWTGVCDPPMPVVQ